MIINIERSVADDPDAFRWLDGLIYRIEDGWHLWDVSGFEDLVDLESSAWVSDGYHRGGRIVETYQKAAVQGA